MRNAKRSRRTTISRPLAISTFAALLLLLPSSSSFRRSGGGGAGSFADAFVAAGRTTVVAGGSRPLARTTAESIPRLSVVGEGGGGSAVAEQPKTDPSREENLSADELKNRLLDLVPRMTGTEEECRVVESTVNALEAMHEPIQTLEFWNWASGGEWQLLFSTNMRPSSRKLRLRELVQRIEPDGIEGTLVNEATWDLAEDGATFRSSGTFSVTRSYGVVRGSSRIAIDAASNDDDDENEAVDPPVLGISKGSAVPNDVPGLVGLLSRSMPTEMFEPTGLFFDTTYLDGDLRIVRFAGEDGKGRHEGVRNVFVRKGQVRIDPTA